MNAVVIDIAVYRNRKRACACPAAALRLGMADRVLVLDLHLALWEEPEMNQQNIPIPAWHEHGRNGERRRNAADVLLDGATACKQAVALLRREGFVPERITVSACGRPSVQISPNEQTAAAIREERACYFQYTSRERHGQFIERPFGVIVTWVERH